MSVKFAGAVLFDGGSATGWTQIGDTLQCVHCGGHWMPVPGSGRRRGWCYRCDGPLCGHDVCFTCIPEEKWLELCERTGRVIDLAAGYDLGQLLREAAMPSIVIAGARPGDR